MLAPGADDDQDLLGQGLEVGTKMDRALERQDAAGGRIDAQMMQNRPVGRLQPPRRDGDLDARRRAGAEQRHRAEIHAVAAVHRPGGGEPATAQPHHLEVARERLDARRAMAAAEPQALEDGTLARLMGGSRRVGIAQEREQRTLGTGGDQRRQ